MCCLGVEIVGAIERRPERRVVQSSGVSIDSRTLQPGEIFFALEGERTDGHRFVREALEKGAAAAVVHTDVAVDDAHNERVIRVEDTLRSLGETARAWRRKWGGVVIAVTGSNGKTTTREMIYHILSGAMPCKRSPRSFNTVTGVPLTLLQAGSEDRALVVELGTNAPGEIRELAGIAEPDIGVITNIAESHLEGLGSIEGVAEAKGELLDALPDGAPAFLNADDPWFDGLAGRHRGVVKSFGLGPRAAFRARAVRPTSRGSWFLVNDTIEVDLPVPGAHNVANAAAALAVAEHMGLSVAAAAARLRDFRLPPMRYQAEAIHGVTVITDCYNANPGSMRAALRTFAERPVTGRRVAVLGDMMELGEAGEGLHAALGADLIRYGLDAVWALGEFGPALVDAARRSGLDGVARCAGSPAEVVSAIRDAVRPGDAILVKGSRGMEMEKLVELFRAAAPAAVEN